MKEKKEWETPKIIVISKSNPEESVLFACDASMASCSSETGAPLQNIGS
ncbi:hypothetical protein [Desulfospira joergensenii]|nr:hypothetical protein [Desulfospira joergensenii]